jgi:transcriptional regulator with XRE-family HTH domain
MVLIHEKITALLEQRRLKKRDLARALGVSPQTATDICKGRSAITLPHLRNLVAFFELRADFWLDDDRLVPGDGDNVASGSSRLAARAGERAALEPASLAALDDPERLLRRLRVFLQRHRAEFLSAFPDLSLEERRLLGLTDAEPGVVGQIGE